MMKECSKCKEVKPYSQFNKDKKGKDGLRSNCKYCQKQYCEENKEKIKQQKKQYYKENKEKIEQYYKENKERRKQYRKEYFKQRRKTDPIFRLICITRTSIQMSLSNKGYSKNTNTYKILGLEYEDFYTWLNTEASNGLSFDKDDVHVDHVIPVSFGKTEEQVLALNHYSNLQLLTSEENLNKHNTYIKRSNLDRVMTHHPNNYLLTKILLNYDYLIF